MSDSNLFESEKVTRKKRIDPRLKKLGWNVTPYVLGLDTSKLSNHAVEEYPTSNGPADYALFVEGRLLGILEAKKVTVATLNTLEQAKRYAKGLVHSIGNWNGYMVPFLFSSNGELIAFLDVRNKNNLSRLQLGREIFERLRGQRSCGLLNNLFRHHRLLRYNRVGCSETGGIRSGCLLFAGRTHRE